MAPDSLTGDSLFPGGVGNTWKDPARFTSLITDVERKIFDRLPDETWFYPGHGDDSTLGRKRPSLPEWRARGCRHAALRRLRDVDTQGVARSPT